MGCNMTDKPIPYCGDLERKYRQIKRKRHRENPIRMTQNEGKKGGGV